MNSDTQGHASPVTMADSAPALRAYLTNCLVAGHTSTERDGQIIRNTITFELGGRTFVLTQHDDVVKQRGSFSGERAITSEVVVSRVSADEVPSVLEAIERLCWLLSFAGLSAVSIAGHDYPDGSGASMRHTVVGVAQYFRPTIDIRLGKEVKSFIEQTYPIFTCLEKTRQLTAVIDYLVQAERPELPVECQLIFASVLLENLKRTYGNSKGIPYIDGYFRKTPGRNADKYSFKELLELMLGEVGMQRSLKAMIDFRNDLLHSGLSNQSHADNFKMYEQMHDLLREYLLRLLGFHGSFPTYASRGAEHIHI